MPLKLLVQSRKFFSQLANGEDFSLNASDFATHLKGSVMEKLKAIYQFDISWDSNSTASEPYDIDGNVIERPAGSFIADGFSIGDEVDLFDAGSPVAGNPRTITNLNDTTMVVDGASLGTFTPSDFLIRGVTELTGYDHRFGLIENDEVFNIISKVEGSDQIYVAKGVGEDTGGGRITTFITAESKGLIKGWQSGSLKVRYVSNPSTYVQRFEFEHIFIVLPYYLEGQLSNLQSVPPLQPDLLDGDSTIKYAVRMQLRNVLSNPNTAKTFTDDQVLGSVGGYGENFNGFNDKFSIDSIAYEEVSSGDSADGIIVGSETKVTVVVNSDDATFTGASIFMVYHSLLPDEDEYSDQEDIFTDIWLYDSKRQTIGAGAVSSTIITDVTGSLLSASQIQIEFNVDFTTAQQNQINIGDNYVLGIQVADTTLSTDDSDKVMLIGDAREYVKSADIAGLLSLTALNIYDHPNATETDVGGSSFTDFNGWVEDGINISFNLSTDLNEAATMTQAKIRLVAFNPTTEDVFDLDEYAFPIGVPVFAASTPNDAQQINIDTNRGYSLKDDDFFNKALLKTTGQLGDDNLFLCRIGMKIRWEDWIALPGADNVFFDNTKENNGLNHNSSNYSLKNGYQVHAFLEFVMEQDGSPTSYIFRTPAFDIRDYDKDAFSPSEEWTATVKTYAANGTEITPAIKTDEETRMEVTWVRTFAPVTDISDFYAIHRIEQQNATGQVIEELSSLAARRPITGSKLIGLVGETRTKISLVSGDVVTECRIDHTQLDPNKDYKLSARLGSITNTPLPTAGTKLQEDGNDKNKEDGDFKKVE